jgi:hypothetical protein
MKCYANVFARSARYDLPMSGGNVVTGSGPRICIVFFAAVRINFSMSAVAPLAGSLNSNTKRSNLVGLHRISSFASVEPQP